MLISKQKTEQLRKDMAERKEVFCSGLYLSARWFVVSEASPAGVNVVILPDKDSAEYCSSDLYALVEGGDFFLRPAKGISSFLSPSM